MIFLVARILGIICAGMGIAYAILGALLTIPAVVDPSLYSLVLYFFIASYALGRLIKWFGEQSAYT